MTIDRRFKKGDNRVGLSRNAVPCKGRACTQVSAGAGTCPASKTCGSLICLRALICFECYLRCHGKKFFFRVHWLGHLNTECLYVVSKEKKWIKNYSCTLPLQCIVFMINKANKSHPIHSLLSLCLTVSLFSISWFLCRHDVLYEKPCLLFALLTLLPCHQIAYMAGSLMLWTPSY